VSRGLKPAQFADANAALKRRSSTAPLAFADVASLAFADVAPLAFADVASTAFVEV